MRPSSAYSKAGPSQPRKSVHEQEVITISDSEEEQPLPPRKSVEIAVQVTPQCRDAATQTSSDTDLLQTQTSSSASHTSQQFPRGVFGTPTLEALGLKKYSNSQSSENSQPSSSTMGTANQRLENSTPPSAANSRKRSASSTYGPVASKNMRKTAPNDSHPEEPQSKCVSSSSTEGNLPTSTSRENGSRNQLPRRSASRVSYKEESDREDSPESDMASDDVTILSPIRLRQSTPGPKTPTKAGKAAKRSRSATGQKKGARRAPPSNLPTCIMCRRPECDPSNAEQVAKDSVTFHRMEKFIDPASGKQQLIHYLCLFTASALHQADIPDAHKNQLRDGHLWGFDLKLIMKDKMRVSKLKCKFCKGNGAAVGCYVPSCQMTYHYPCSVEKGCSFNFTGVFESYCPKHKQKFEVARPPRNMWKSAECVICKDKPNAEDELNTLVTPCCHYVFHRFCVARFATNAGKHCLKCPGCNKVDEFKEFCNKVGIHIPNTEATWITEEDRRLNEEEQKAPPDRCTPRDEEGKGQVCPCPQGPEHDERVEGHEWNIERCAGGCETVLHRKCMQVGPDQSLYCGFCYALVLEIADK